MPQKAKVSPPLASTNYFVIQFTWLCFCKGINHWILAVPKNIYIFSFLRMHFEPFIHSKIKGFVEVLSIYAYILFFLLCFIGVLLWFVPLAVY